MAPWRGKQGRGGGARNTRRRRPRWGSPPSRLSLPAAIESSSASTPQPLGAPLRAPHGPLRRRPSSLSRRHCRPTVHLATPFTLRRATGHSRPLTCVALLSEFCILEQSSPKQIVLKLVEWSCIFWKWSAMDRNSNGLKPHHFHAGTAHTARKVSKHAAAAFSWALAFHIAQSKPPLIVQRHVPG